ncbi:MAG: hypothetical protein U0169_13510 [Polyangiaceae bacterium]
MAGRGVAVDLDVLVFGGREGLDTRPASSAPRVTATGIRVSVRSVRAWVGPIDHAFFVKEVGKGEVLAIDLHSAPRVSTWGLRAPLVAWFATQGREIPWTSAVTGRPGRMFTLSDEGTPLMAVINAFKDECIRVRDLADVARLCELHGATLDWDAIAAVARQRDDRARRLRTRRRGGAGRTPSSRSRPPWRTTFVGSPALAPYLTARAIVRSPAPRRFRPGGRRRVRREDRPSCSVPVGVRRAGRRHVVVAKLKRSVLRGRGGERSTIRGARFDPRERVRVGDVPMSETFAVAFGVGIVVVVDDGTRTEDVRARLPGGDRCIPTASRWRARTASVSTGPPSSAFRRDDGPELFCKHDLALLDASPSTTRRSSSRRVPAVRVRPRGGAVAWHGGAWLFPGTSHAGKTSLVRALVAHGATYLPDDVALLDDDGHAWPYASAMSVKERANGSASRRRARRPRRRRSPSSGSCHRICAGRRVRSTPLPRERALLAPCTTLSVQFSPDFHDGTPPAGATVGARHFLEGRRGDAARPPRTSSGKFAVAAAEEEPSAGRA